MILYIDKQNNVIDVDGAHTSGSNDSTSNTSSLKKYKTTITKNGDNKIFTINHDIGTEDVIVEMNDGTDPVFIDWIAVDKDNIKLTFAEVPKSTDKYNITIWGVEDESPDKIYLYNNGDECVDITGGWIKIDYSSNIQNECIFTNNDDSLQFTIPAGKYCQMITIRTLNDVPLNEYSKLVVKYTSNLVISGSENSAGGFDLDYGTSINAVNESGSAFIQLIPIKIGSNVSVERTLSGEYFPYLGIQTWYFDKSHIQTYDQTLKIYEIYLEK